MNLVLPDLYIHQGDMRDDTRTALRKYIRVILTAGPGVGKTRIAKWILGASANREPSGNQSGKSLFAVHRRGLVQNASDSFAEEPRLPHGVIMSGVKGAYGHRIQVASIDTLLSWFIEEGQYETSVTFDLIVYDETHAHLSKLKKFLEHHDAYRKELGLHPAYVIGLTATPQAKGLADVYSELVLGPPTQWLIDNGFLCPFRYFQGVQGDLSLLKRHGNEFTKASESAAMDGMSGDLVRDWKKFAEGRPTVGFFPRRTHAQDAMSLLSDAGIRVAYVDGETPDDARSRIFWELGNGQLDYLCNVQVVERGTDIPAIACVQLCVAIGSKKRLLQMIGRGSRIHPGKTDCCVARGTMILTDRGEIPIQHVTLIDLVWDGMEYCRHDGPCYNGTKEVIEWESLVLTPDHKVLTNDGWKEAGAAKSGQWGAIAGGIGGKPVWAADDSNPHNPGERIQARGRSGLFTLRKAWVASLLQNLTKGAAWLRALHGKVRPTLPGMDLEASSAPATEVSVSSKRGISPLRWAWDRIQILFDLRRGVLDCGKSRTTAEQVVDPGPHRKRRPLRAGEHPVGNLDNAVSQSQFCLAGQAPTGSPVRDVLRHSAIESEKARTDSAADCRPMVVEVWDIRNAGPRNRYCANGVIVANCVIDHGGSVQRLQTFFEDDQHWSLDNSSEKTGDIVAQPTIECPQCQALYRGGKCRSCGYEPTPNERKGQGLEFDGRELKEITRKDKPKTTEKSPEEMMTSALYAAGRSGRTWKQCVGMYLGANKKQGTKRRVPKTITVGGHRYQMLGYGDSRGGKRVSALYPFTKTGGAHGGDLCLGEV